MNKIYPRFFEVDDIYVVLELEDGLIEAHTHGGRPYSIGKTLTEGGEISKYTYLMATKPYAPIYLPS